MLHRVLCAVVAILTVTVQVRADDAYYRIPVVELEVAEGALPEVDPDADPWRSRHVLVPYAVLDGPGEAYAVIADEGGWGGYWTTQKGILLVRAPAARPVAGTLFVPNSAWTGLVPVRFTIDPAAASDARGEFYNARLDHYTRLQNSGAPGTAWFRHKADETRRILAELDQPAQEQPWARPGRELSDTYNLFTGGRAVSENLQLSRELPPPTPAEPADPEEMVDVSTLPGITVRAMDWKAALGSAKPELDALAAIIPADQHAVFFPGIEALIAVADQTNEEGLPVFRATRPRSEDARLVERYERQLGISRSGIARVLGPRLVKSVALTGSDPYFPTGTDVALLFQAHDTAMLRGVLLTQIKLAGGMVPGAAAKAGEIDGLAYEGMASEDRAMSSYVAVVGDAVVVTNSLRQLSRLAAVGQGAQSLASLDEFKFFRNRYPLNAPGETAFVFLSDAAIRRWCGPEWRIGASRRLRAAAILSDMTAVHAPAIAAGVAEPRSVEPTMAMRTLGATSLDRGGIRSSVYNNLTFITPISELGITQVTGDEAAAYNRWRDTYQRNWSWAFDPIGISLSVGRELVSADMTVMPLIVGSQYRTWITVAQGAAIAPGAGDPHDAIAHGVMAINVNSPAVIQATAFLAMMAPDLQIEPLGWMGESVALYADPDPFWAEMLAAEDQGRFFEESIHRLPVGLYAEVASPLKLTAFLAAARAFVDQSAPGMMAWESRTHSGQAYVRVGLTEAAREEAGGGGFDKMSVYYAAMPRALILSPNEDLLKRAIDRQLQRSKEKEAAPAAEPWLGTSMALRFHQEGLDLIQGGESMRRRMQALAWSNIPILNEWKREVPDEDPAAVHGELWAAHPICPGGGKYVWNEKYRTMESTVYGHPGEPGPGPTGLGPLEAITSGSMGLTFEENGLRARAAIRRTPAKP